MTLKVETFGKEVRGFDEDFSPGCSAVYGSYREADAPNFLMRHPVEVRQGLCAGTLIGFLIGPRQSIIAFGLFGCVVTPLLLLLATDEIISAHLLIYGGE